MVVEQIIWVSIISYGEIHFDIQVLWITSMFLEWIILAIQGFTVEVISEPFITMGNDHLWMYFEIN